MKKIGARGGHSNLPVPKVSKGSPGNAKSLGRGANHAHSAEDIPGHVFSVGSSGASPQRRAISPGGDQRKGLAVRSSQDIGQAGVRYITEDLLKKVTKEENLEMVTTLNLTLSKEGGKKIKYIENLERLKRLQVLNMSSNIIEKMERLDKLLKLKELNLSNNCITKIEGLENLTNLQVLNLNNNAIEHIPIWMGKRLKALRVFHIGKNKLESLNELSKLKPLPDLTQLTVAENPLSEQSHCRPYLVFHIRTLEVIDGQPVNDKEREKAKGRFEQDELERLEKQLEQEEQKFRRLEEDHNRSQQERSHLSATEDELKRREKAQTERIRELEKELETKNDILKKKTQELNKACEKHYQLEQELAFYKIDSKFDSLGRGPEPSYEEGEDSGLLGESPYIGRARYKANKFAADGSVMSASPQRAQIQSVMELPHGASPMRAQLHEVLDEELAQKQEKVHKANNGVKEAEDRLKRLTEDLMATERKLQQATRDLKKMGDSTLQEKEDQKIIIRQKLASKMQTVNDMRDSASQIEGEMEKTRKALQKDKVELTRLKNQLTQMDNTDPAYRRVYAEMVDKEQQINESNQMYGQLQDQLELMLDTVARETNDIKRLEQQLQDNQIEQNDELREDLDSIVGGLQTYLSEVQTKGARQQQEFQELLVEKEELQHHIRKLEGELTVLDTEASKFREMEKQFLELQDSLRAQEDLNRTLHDQLHHSRQQDTEHQDRLETKDLETATLRNALRNAEQKAKAEKEAFERLLQVEKEKAQEASKKALEVHRKEDEIRKLASQLEASKNLNVSMKEKLNEERNQMKSKLNETLEPNLLKKRMRDLSQTVKQGKSPVEPEDEKDFVGKTFKDLQNFMNERLNRSVKELEKAKEINQKATSETQTLAENLKKMEQKLAKTEGKDSKHIQEKKQDEAMIKKLNEEIQQLRNALKEARNRLKQGQTSTKIVYDPDRASVSSRGSLNSEEKFLFDELQKELLELRRTMRNKEDDTSKRLVDAEAEAAMLEQALHDQEKDYERELAKIREEAELSREKQEARMQVIAADLDQAQHVADFLQRMLDERDQQLHGENHQATMSNHLIGSQEEELARLYEILETQKDEIDNLNAILDQLAQQGAEGAVGEAFDEELWRLRQEVNRLKETLAMQSAYVQTMTPLQMSAGTQAQTQMYADHGQAAGPAARPFTQYSEGPMSYFPPMIGRATAATSYAPAGGFEPQGGADQREVKTPPGGRPSDGRSTMTRPSQSPLRRMAERGADADGVDRLSDRSRRSGRNRHRSIGGNRDLERETTRKTAFEPVQRPQTYISNLAGPQIQAFSTPGQGAPLGLSGVMHGSTIDPVTGAPRGMQTVGVGMMNRAGQTVPFNMGPPGTLPSGYQVAMETGIGATQTPGYANVQTPGFVSVQTPNFAASQGGFGGIGGGGGGAGIGAGSTGFPFSQQAYPVGADSAQPSVAMGTDHLQHPSFPRGTGHISHQAHQRIVPPLVKGHPAQPSVAIGTGQHTVSMGTGTHGYAATQTGGFAAPGFRLPYDTGKVFLPAYSTLPSRPPARIYYSHSRGGGAGGGGGGHGDPSHPGQAQSFGSPDRSMKFLPMSPLASGTPVGGHHAPRVVAANVVIPSPINYIAELQEKLKKFKARYARDKERAEDEKEYGLIRRLQRELEERRDELEGLDLAIERQKKNLHVMKSEERHLEMERESAKDKLAYLKNLNKKRRHADVESDAFDEKMEGCRHNYMKDEIECLERTLAKRRMQLKEADRLLKQCNMDLKDARTQARETVKKYDNATYSLETTVKETSELERRANLAGVELLKATESLANIRAQIHDYDRKRGKQERLLRDVNSLLSKRDLEFKDIDSRARSAADNLSRLQGELTVLSQKEKDTVGALRDSEDILAKRRMEISRMRDQEQRELLKNLDVQKTDLMVTIKSKKGELQKLKDDVETEEEMLQKLVSTVNRHKAELKHTFEMQTLEQRELENLKSQHAQRMSELEKIQRALLDVKTDLEQLNSEATKKAAEVDRLRAMIERDREEVERLTLEKSSLEDRITAMSRERELLDENCKSLDDKVNQMKKNHRVMEEKIDHTARRLETLELELHQREKDMEEASHQKAALQKDIQMLKVNVKEGKNELKILKENVRDAESQVKHLEQTLRETHQQRDEAKLEIDRLNEGIRQSRSTYEESLHQQRAKEQELQDLIRTVEQKDVEYQEARQTLSKVRKEVEKEETKLNKLVSRANKELENIRNDLNAKQSELNQASLSVAKFKREAESLQAYEEKVVEMDKKMKEYEHEILKRDEEKNELAKALTRSYEELQKLRTTSSQDQEKMLRERCQLENALQDMQVHLDQTKKEMEQVQKRCSAQVAELQNLAEEQFNRANCLNEELKRIKAGVTGSKQDLTRVEERQKPMVNGHISSSNGEAAGLKRERAETGPDEPRQVTPPATLSSQSQGEVAPGNKIHIDDPSHDERKSDTVKGKLSKEQDHLRRQLQEQMQRHADAMEQARLQSEGTLENLRRKLNTLQDVLINTGDSPVKTRSRSQSPRAYSSPLSDRHRSISPGYTRKGYLAQRPRSRSRSYERLSSPVLPERDCKIRLTES
ncbi:hypothetical protein ACJMK2_038429 [Sinanodonta woodiana]|uniref:Centriolin n=1 Tax=Sinanodonta woodiana TaxID=1069815 RepID=A0ABD3W8Z3_SINWO